MKLNKSKLIAGIVLITCMLISHLVIYQIEERDKLERQNIAMQVVANTANIIDQQLSMSLSSTKALGSLIQQYGDIPDFDSLAHQMLEIYGGISCLQLAPGGVIKKCYPLKGNEKIIGGNPLISPKRRTESKKALETGKLTLAGPFELSQGGVGAIGRYPVFTTDEFGVKHFWGFTIAIIDFPEFLKIIGIRKLDESGYYYWLWRIHPDSGVQDIFASNANELDLNNTINFNIQVPNSQWTLSAIPKNGWLNIFVSRIWHIGLLFCSIFISIAIYLWLQRTQLLRNRTNLLKESELRLIEANASKDKFFSIIAHDLRGPVGSLFNISELLQNSYHEFDDKERLEFISFLKDGSNRTAILLDNLLLWARSQNGTIEWKPISFDIMETISSAVDLFENLSSQKQQEIIVDGIDQIIVFADKDMITTVIRNLVSNAIKFTPKNGEIQILTSIDNSSNCKIIIKDSGVGIPPENLKVLFKLDKTQSTKGTENETGSGLGLMLCKEFIEKNNGVLKVESELNRGSSFIFTLPLDGLAKV